MLFVVASPPTACSLLLHRLEFVHLLVLQLFSMLFQQLMLVLEHAFIRIVLARAKHAAVCVHRFAWLLRTSSSRLSFAYIDRRRSKRWGRSARNVRLRARLLGRCATSSTSRRNMVGRRPPCFKMGHWTGTTVWWGTWQWAGWVT